MKLPVIANRSKGRRHRTLAGAILAEGAIGLCLLVFVWILFSYISYMSNNRIRANMSARYSAWLSGNGVSSTTSASTDQYAFLGDDQKMVTFKSTKNTLGFLGVSVPTMIVPNPYIYSNSVTFGTNSADINSDSPFPFNMLALNKLPFMRVDLMMTNFTMVSAHCAWPDVSDTYNTYLPPAISAVAALELAWEGGIFTQ
jgi:hypothetical protein